MKKLITSIIRKIKNPLVASAIVILLLCHLPVVKHSFSDAFLFWPLNTLAAVFLLLGIFADKKFFRGLFGEVQYQGPQWWQDFRAMDRNAFRQQWLERWRGRRQKLQNKIQQHPKQALALGLGSVIVIVAAAWYVMSPKPVPPPAVTANVIAPSTTHYYLDQQRKIYPLIHPLIIQFDRAAAPLEKIGKDPGPGVTLRPALAGKWNWSNETLLQFTPEKEWPMGEKIKIFMDQSLITPHAELQTDVLEFSTEPFKVKFESNEFYEDPRDPRKRKVIARFSFNYPVDEESFSRSITAEIKEYSKKSKIPSSRPLKLDFFYDDTRYNAFVHTEELKIPKEEAEVKITSNAAKSSKGGEPYKFNIESSTRIPGLYNYFHFKSVDTQVVNDLEGMPQHALIIQSSTGIAPEQLKGALQIWQLPLKWQFKKMTEAQKIDWSESHHQRSINEEILAASKKISVDSLPTIETYPKNHSFKIQPDFDHYLYVQIKQGLQSGGGFELSKSHTAVSKVPPFPQQVRIAMDGGIVSLRGDRKLSFFTVNVKELKVEIGQVLPEQVQHILSKNYGDLSKPSLSGISPQDLAHFEVEKKSLGSVSASAPVQQFIDFNRYLGRQLKGKNGRGMFFIKIQSTQSVENRESEASDSESGEGDEYDDSYQYSYQQPPTQDERFILVTDLGVTVKRDLKGESHVFVQSLSTGRPVAGAEVHLSGQNGLPILSQVTNAQGHAVFPKYERGENAARATGWIVKKEDDLAFMAMDSYNRLLNYSRFNTGGENSVMSDDKLKAYVFTDRGTYRPGESGKIGFIAKTTNWNLSLAGLPIEVKITDPQGKTILQKPLELRASGLGEISFDLQGNDRTGEYTVQLMNFHQNNRSKYSMIMGSTTLQVQEFLPDRLKIRANLNKQKTLGWVSPEDLGAEVNLSNLFGIAAENHEIRGRYSLEHVFLSFPQFDGYRFDNPSKDFEPHSQDLPTTMTDGEGNAKLSIDLSAYAKKVFRLRFTAEGLEKEGGRSVMTETSTLVSPFSYLVGIKALGDFLYIKKQDQRDIDFIAVDSELKPTSVPKLTLERLESKYVNVLTQKSNGSWGYESVLKEESLSKDPLNIASTGYKYVLPTAQAGDFIIRISDADGQIYSEFRYSVMGERNLARALNRSAELQVKLSKNDYSPGEMIQMEIRAPYTGMALITVEKDRIYDFRWVSLQSSTSIETIPVPANLEGNAYVNISLLRSSNSREIYMSPISYGAYPFTISKQSRMVDIDLKAPSVAKPGGPFTVEYSASHEGEMVLFAINEGILQFAKYQNPDPLAYFLTKKSLQVQTWQILDQLLPEYSILQEILAAGGGDGSEISGQLNPFKRKSKKPIAFWSGIVKAGPQAKKWSFDVPGDFNGSLRILAVAVSGKRMGHQIAKSLLQADLIITPNVPTFVSPGEKFTLPVTVLNNTENKKGAEEVEFKVESGDDFKFSGSQSIKKSIERLKDASHIFEIMAGPKLGEKSLKIIASTAGTKNQTEESLSVRPLTPYHTHLQLGTVRNGKQDIDVSGKKMHSEFSKYKVTLAPTPVAFAQSLMAYLEEYPYGCSEQILSRAWPLVLINELTAMENLSVKAGTSPQQTLSSLISILRTRMTGEGSLSIYPNVNDSASFLSMYFMHLLLESKRRNQVVPDSLINDLAAYIKTVINENPFKIERAYGIYLLTLNEEVTTPFLANIESELQEAQERLKNGKAEHGDDLMTAYLAASYQILKDKSKAQSLIKNLKWGRDEKMDNYVFYSDITRDAQILYLLSRHFPDHVKAIDTDFLSSFFQRLQKNINSIHAAYSLLAIAAYGEHYMREAIQGIEVQAVDGKGNKRPLTLVGNIKKTATFDASTDKIQIKNQNDVPLFYSVTQAGFDLQYPGKTQSGLEIHKEVLDTDGKPIKEIKMGEEAIVKLTLRSINNLVHENTAITDLLPTGFEMVIRPDATVKAQGGFKLDYSDSREDRMLIYGSLDAQAGEINYRIKATHSGEFIVPAAFAENLYQSQYRAFSSQEKMIIKR